MCKRLRQTEQQLVGCSFIQELVCFIVMFHIHLFNVNKLLACQLTSSRQADVVTEQIIETQPSAGDDTVTNSHQNQDGEGVWM